MVLCTLACPINLAGNIHGQVNFYATNEASVNAKEFYEVSHSGGKVTFHFQLGPEGNLQFSTQFTGSRPVPMVLIGVYALLEDGIPVLDFDMGGIGQPFRPGPPVSGCVPVFVVSDSEGHFGHKCPKCDGYWRGGSRDRVCPYCFVRGQPYQFLSNAQKSYITHWCDVLRTALDEGKEGEAVIDMDAVADATGKDTPKPDFYVSEQAQQHRFVCQACNSFNDIIGRYGYCGTCGTRNDYQDFDEQTVPEIRRQLNDGGSPEKALQSAVSEFESFTDQLMHELTKHASLSSRRSATLKKRRFHNVEEVARILTNWFDIDLGNGLSEEDWLLVVRMFHRRHVYEHKGGVVDQKYINDSGDDSVRVRERIRETQADVHEFVGLLHRMARNIHTGFHDIFEPLEEPIEIEKERRSRIRA